MIVPFPLGYELGMMTEIDFVNHDNSLAYHTKHVNFVSDGHDSVEDLSTHVEFFSVTSTKNGVEWVETMSVWFIYSLTPNFMRTHRI